MKEPQASPHDLILKDRSRLALTGVTEVISFDENTVLLRTGAGDLSVHGQDLHMKNLSLEGGQVAVEGTVCALVYEEPRRQGGVLRRLLG